MIMKRLTFNWQIYRGEEFERRKYPFIFLPKIFKYGQPMPESNTENATNFRIWNNI